MARRTEPKPSRRWIWGLLVVLLLIVGAVMVSTYQRFQDERLTVARTLCSQQYAIYTTEWRNCVDAMR